MVKFLMWAMLTHKHLSQLVEDLVIMNLMKGVVIYNAYVTAFSLMPQKKNPGCVGVAKGEVGVVLGCAVGFTVKIKGLSRVYTKNLQDDKVPLFETVYLVKGCLHIAVGLISTLMLK